MANRQSERKKMRTAKRREDGAVHLSEKTGAVIVEARGMTTFHLVNLQGVTFCQLPASSWKTLNPLMRASESRVCPTCLHRAQQVEMVELEMTRAEMAQCINEAIEEINASN